MVARQLQFVESLDLLSREGEIAIGFLEFVGEDLSGVGVSTQTEGHHKVIQNLVVAASKKVANHFTLLHNCKLRLVSFSQDYGVDGLGCSINIRALLVKNREGFLLLS